MLQWLYMYVARVCPQYLICFPDVCCKCVYLDVAYFHTYVASIFIWMLRMFAMFFQVFFQVFETHVSSVSSVFFLHVCKCLHLDVSKTNQVLQM
jgi:hypothetical protein